MVWNKSENKLEIICIWHYSDLKGDLTLWETVKITECCAAGIASVWIIAGFYFSVKKEKYKKFPKYKKYLWENDKNGS